MNTQTVINIALGLAVAFLLYANQGQGVIIADLESKLTINTLEDALREKEFKETSRTELEVCTDELTGMNNPYNKSDVPSPMNRRQAMISCMSLKK